MAKKRWVNLPEDDKSYKRADLMGDDIDDVDAMGREVHIRAKVDKKDAKKVVLLKIEPGGDNAKYEPEESKLAAYKFGIAGVSAEGEVDFKIRLSAAGGDTYKFKVVDTADNEKALPDEVETHRKIYVQVIGMDTILDKAAVGAVKDLGFLKSEYKSQKRNIDIQITASGKTITHRWNHNSRVALLEMNLRIDADGAYDKSRDPFSFVCVFVDCLALGPTSFTVKDMPAARAGFFKRVFGKDGVDVPFNLPSNYRLWYKIDKGPHAEKWLIKAEFIPDGGGARIDMKNDVERASGSSIRLRTKNLPAGAKGKFRVVLNVAEGCYGGYSKSKMNMVVIGTRDYTDHEFDVDDMKFVLIHEIGHKLGMVPTGEGGLKKQSTHDDVHDPAKKSHCNDKGCVMWWQMTKARTFCGACQQSLRKVNLHSPELPNFFPFYK
jgi:hypothetical protein